jgi:hypothetical protein
VTWSQPQTGAGVRSQNTGRGSHRPVASAQLFFWHSHESEQSPSLVQGIPPALPPIPVPALPPIPVPALPPISVPAPPPIAVAAPPTAMPALPPLGVPPPTVAGVPPFAPPSLGLPAIATMAGNSNNTTSSGAQRSRDNEIALSPQAKPRQEARIADT